MSPFYQFDTGNIGGSLLAGVSGFMSVFVALYYIVVYGLALTVYILEAVSLYSIAKRRGVHHAWLAWVPIGNVWILGSISDQYQYIAKGEIRVRRKVLVGLTLATVALTMLTSAFLGISMLTSTANINIGSFFFGAFLAVGILCNIAMLLIALVQTIFLYVAYFDVYASCNPRNAILYLIFSIVFPFLIPFLLFGCRKKDRGMPVQPVPVAEVEASEEAPAIPSPAVAVAEAMAEAAEEAEPVEAEEATAEETTAEAEETPAEADPE